MAEFARHYHITFNRPELLKLALTHRSYLSVTGQGPRDSNERLEFLGDSVLGLVTSEFLYLAHPNEHEGQLTKTKSLLVSKAILSRRALAMGLGRFVLMSHSEVESGGRQRLSILADAFESVVGAIYLDQGFDAARSFIERWLLRDSREISADKRHTNYKSQLQEYVQSTFRTHPVYRIRSEVGPDHSKQFVVEVTVGRRTLGEGKGHNKKEAEQSAARDAIERVGSGSRERREPERERDHEREHDHEHEPAEATSVAMDAEAGEPDDAGDVESGRRRRRGRRGGRGRRRSEEAAPSPAVGEARDLLPEPVVEAEPEPEVEEPAPRRRREPRPEPSRRAPRAEVAAEPRRRAQPPPPPPDEVEPMPAHDFDEHEEIGRPDGPLEDRHIDPYEIDTEPRARTVARPMRAQPVNEPRPRAVEDRRDEPEWNAPTVEPETPERGGSSPGAERSSRFGRRPGRPKRSR